MIGMKGNAWVRLDVQVILACKGSFVIRNLPFANEFQE